MKALKKHFEKTAASVSRAKAVEEIFKLRWGPTSVPVYNIILIFLYMQTQNRAKYVDIADTSQETRLLGSTGWTCPATRP